MTTDAFLNPIPTQTMNNPVTITAVEYASTWFLLGILVAGFLALAIYTHTNKNK